VSVEEIEEIGPQELETGLKKIRRRRWFFWLTILAYLPAMLFALRSPQSGQAVIITFVVWVLVLVVAVALMALVRCPNCGNCFHMNGFLFRPVRQCYHCRLHITADKKK
jgi:cell division protein FtsW (lipid II flippase)